MPKALIATDGSDFARDAALRAKQVLDGRMEYTLLTVVPPPVLPVGAPVTGIETAPIATPETADALSEAYKEEAQQSLESTAEAFGGPADPNRQVTRRTEFGDPAAEICRVASDEAFDVIVVGSHGSGFVKRVLLGSVSKHLLHHAPCPVLVVRPSDHS